MTKAALLTFVRSHWLGDNTGTEFLARKTSLRLKRDNRYEKMPVQTTTMHEICLNFKFYWPN